MLAITMKRCLHCKLLLMLDLIKSMHGAITSKIWSLKFIDSLSGSMKDTYAYIQQQTPCLAFSFRYQWGTVSAT